VSENLQQLQQRLEYDFTDPALLKLALTHRSCGSHNNERLEFLGDAVLGLIMADFLSAEFPELREGELSRMRSNMVCAESLAKVAKHLQLGPDLFLGPSEIKSGAQRRDSILGDTVEALIGAVYRDADFQQARDCVLRWFKPLLEVAKEIKPIKDAKTSLQEFLQQRAQPLPDYRVVETGGEPHKRLYTVSCRINFLDREFSATATSRRKAEQQVAEQFLTLIKADTNDV
jgi:ribonuclease-3